jgi:hypothetical protein
MSDDFFAPPAFKPDEALIQLKRALRDLHALSERGNGFELKGKRVLELQVDGATIAARIARRPALTPEWDARVLKNNADVRKFVDETKQRLARWSDDE